MARSWALASILALALGCGGESVRNAPRGADGGRSSGGAESNPVAGAPSAAAGAKPEVSVPTKNGVPISDCREPTPEELIAAGCPPVEPIPEDACDLPEGTRCEYEIVTSSGWSEQRLAICEQHAWSQIFGNLCGATCAPVGPTRTLDTADCLARASEPCKTTSGPDDWPISAFAATLGRLSDIIIGECGLPIGRGDKVELDFADGCPSSLSTSSRVEASEVDCLVNALSVERWECAEPTLCVTWDLDIR